MACVEMVVNNSPEAAKLYQELVDGWAAPGLKAFYRQFIGEVDPAVKEDWKESLRKPELVLGSNPNQVFEVYGGLLSSGSLEPVGWAQQAMAMAEGLPENSPEGLALAEWFKRMFSFILEGFNRQEDLQTGIVRVSPFDESLWLRLAVLYRSGLEHGGITQDRVQRAFKVREVKGKPVDFEKELVEKPTGRLHRQVTQAGKQAGLSLRHDHTFEDAAWYWYQSRIVHPSVYQYVNAASFTEENPPNLKNVQKAVQACDTAVGFRRHRHKP